MAGLLDPAVFAAKRQEESRLRAAVDANPEWKAKWSSAWDEVAAAQDSIVSFRDRLNALGGGNLRLGARTASIAITLVRLADELEKPSAERLREYGDAALPSLYQGLYSPAPITPTTRSSTSSGRLERPSSSAATIRS